MSQTRYIRICFGFLASLPNNSPSMPQPNIPRQTSNLCVSGTCKHIWKPLIPRVRRTVLNECQPLSCASVLQARVTVTVATVLVLLMATLLPVAPVIAAQTNQQACGHIRLITSAEATTTDNPTTSRSNSIAVRVLADIDKLILETGFNCSVEKSTVNSSLAVPADSTTPAFASAVPFDLPDPSANTEQKPAVRSINSGPLTDTGPGWWINADAVEKHPELVTVLDVLEHPELFADSGPGIFVGCPPGSDCQHINTNLFRAFQMQDKGWQLITPANQAELDASMLQTVEQGQNWFGYYHAPSAVMSQLDLIRLEFGIEFTGNKNWNGCITQPVDECADPRPTGWRPLTLHTVINEPLSDEAPPEVLTYLSSRVVPGPVLASLLAEASNEQTETVDLAGLFIRQHRELWDQWVPEDVADKMAKDVAPPH